MKGYSLRLHMSRYLCNGEATAIALRRTDFVNKSLIGMTNKK